MNSGNLFSPEAKELLEKLLDGSAADPEIQEYGSFIADDKRANIQPQAGVGHRQYVIAHIPSEAEADEVVESFRSEDCQAQKFQESDGSWTVVAYCPR